MDLFEKATNPGTTSPEETEKRKAKERIEFGKKLRTKIESIRIVVLIMYYLYLLDVASITALGKSNTHSVKEQLSTEATDLADSPGGGELLALVGYVYEQGVVKVKEIQLI